MEIVNFFLHLDHHMNEVLKTYGTWTYLIMFVIVFCETGLVFTPFLPGDSLLFVLGTFAALGSLKISWVWFLLSAAAILGNMTNYAIGQFLAPKIFRQEKIRFLNADYLKRTEKFYKKYGAKTIIITRFLPILRTIAPFLAGVGSMPYLRFAIYNIIGGVLWVTGFTFGGYFFGNLPAVKRNFSLVVLLIIVISIIPAVVEFLRHRKKP